jgi:ElaA protein
MSEIIWVCKPFATLTAAELYEALKLRSEVFVVEQNCVYLDLDDKDQDSFHLFGWQDDNLLAYARILPPGLAYEEASIGRVVSSPSSRKTGAGRALMNKAIEETISLFGTQSIRIGAQLYLLDFYGSLGFKQVSEPYLEDGILHIKMILSK